MVQALHEKGIVHRDLKPQNVLLTNSQRGKVSDMGLSKQLVMHQSSFDSLGCSGSSGWQAPEQVLLRDGRTARQTKVRTAQHLPVALEWQYCVTSDCGNSPPDQGACLSALACAFGMAVRCVTSDSLW